MSEPNLDPASQQTPAQPPRADSSTSSARRGTVRSIHYALSYLAQNPERGPQGAIVLANA